MEQKFKKWASGEGQQVYSFLKQGFYSEERCKKDKEQINKIILEYQKTHSLKLEREIYKYHILYIVQLARTIYINQTLYLSISDIIAEGLVCLYASALKYNPKQNDCFIAYCGKTLHLIMSYVNHRERELISEAKKNKSSGKKWIGYKNIKYINCCSLSEKEKLEEDPDIFLNKMMEQEEEDRKINYILNKLDEEELKLVCLKYFDELKWYEISKIMNKSEYLLKNKFAEIHKRIIDNQ